MHLVNSLFTWIEPPLLFVKHSYYIIFYLICLSKNTRKRKKISIQHLPNKDCLENSRKLWQSIQCIHVHFTRSNIDSAQLLSHQLSDLFETMIQIGVSRCAFFFFFSDKRYPDAFSLDIDWSCTSSHRSGTFFILSIISYS